MGIAERQISAGGAVKHPAWHDNHHARRRFDVAQTDAGPYLAVMLAHTPAEQCVPAVMNLDFVLNTGRMNGRSLSAANLGCSPVPSAAPNGPPSCTP
jgi:hypothetical protein